jgi:putative sterol carrier protein
VEQSADLSQVTPEQFAQLAAVASDDDILTGIRATGTKAVLERIFQGMQERFVPEKAAGANVRIQWVVSDSGEEHAYTATIENGTCVIAPGKSEGVTVVLGADLVTFIRLIGGQQNGAYLFMTGKLKVGGDLMMAQRIETFFDRPKAG